MNLLYKIKESKYGPFIEILLQYPRLDKCRPYIVGGAVRDIILGLEINDLDIVVHDLLVDFSNWLEKQAGMKVFSFINEGGSHIKRLTNDDLQVDISALSTTLEIDLSNRDFTINGMSIDLAKTKGELYDPYNFTRHIPECCFELIKSNGIKSDPLRILRSARLIAKTGFEPTYQTEDIMTRQSHLIKQVASERVHEELIKILSLPKGAYAIGQIIKMGVLNNLFPEIGQCDNCKQNDFHTLDVLNHMKNTMYTTSGIINSIQNYDTSQKARIILACEPLYGREQRVKEYLNETYPNGTKKYALIKLAALLHDIGKPSTKSIKNGNITFHGHEHAGAEIVTKRLAKLGFPSYENDFITQCVAGHMYPLHLSNSNFKNSAIYRFFRKFKDQALAIILISSAEASFSGGKAMTQARKNRHKLILKKMLSAYCENPHSYVSPKPLVNGDVLMQELNLAQGPIIGKLINLIVEKTVDGEISTTEEALELARHVMAEDKENN
jgi:putative nucleotidyltransferase with HDIG domain